MGSIFVSHYAMSLQLTNDFHLNVFDRSVFHLLSCKMLCDTGDL